MGLVGPQYAAVRKPKPIYIQLKTRDCDVTSVFHWFLYDQYEYLKGLVES